MKQNGLWVIAFVIVALMVLTTVNPASLYRTEEIDDTTYHIGDLPLDNPDVGDLWYDTTLDEMNIYNGYVWQSLVPTVSGADYKDHVAKHYWGGVDPIQFHKLSPEIRVASEFATSGSGTQTDPYINGINEAIDDLPSGIGGTVLLQGVTEIDATIEIDRPLTLQGQGMGLVDSYIPNTLIRLADNSDCNMINLTGTDVYQQHFKVLKDFGLDGNKNNQGGGSAIINIENTADSIFENLILLNAYSHSVHMSKGNTWHIEFRNCLFENAGSYGFVIDPSSGYIKNVMFDKCLFYDSAGDEIRIVSNDVFFVDIGNSIIDSTRQHGIHLLGGYRINIHDNFIRDCSRKTTNTYDAILIEDSAGGDHSLNCQIHHNQIEGVFYTQMRYGVNIGANSDYIMVDHNIIKNIVTEPIHISSGANANGLVAGNIGYCTEKSNSTTISNGNTHVIVTHGMDVTPTSITVTGNHSEVSSCWIVNITATQFEIWVSSAVTYDRVVYWYAEAR